VEQEVTTDSQNKLNKIQQNKKTVIFAKRLTKRSPLGTGLISASHDGERH
jgi:hypothetical protein